MGNWLMEPDHDIADYSEVPWFRRTWFVMITIFLFWPLTLLVVATGPIFQKANRKAKQQSDAEVWRSTGPGRAVMLVSFAVIGLIFTFTTALPFLDDLREDDSGRRSFVAAPAEETEPTEDPDEPAAVDSDAAAGDGASAPAGDAGAEQTTEAPATTAAAPPPPAEATPADARLDELRTDLIGLADTTLGTSDPTPILAAVIGDDRFLDFPQLSGVSLRYVDVSYELNDGQPQYAMSTIARTDRSADEAVAELQELFAARGHVQEDLEDETEDGEREVSVDYEPLTAGQFGFEGLTFDVTEDAEGTEVRVFRFVIDPAQPTDSTLLTRAAAAFVPPNGHEWVGSGFTLNQGFGGSEADVELNFSSPVPNGERDAVFDEYIAAQTTWVEEERLDTITRLGNTVLGLDAYLSVFANDDRTDVTVRIG